MVRTFVCLSVQHDRKFSPILQRVAYEGQRPESIRFCSQSESAVPTSLHQSAFENSEGDHHEQSCLHVAQIPVSL